MSIYPCFFITILLHSLTAITAVQVAGYTVTDWAFHDPLSGVITSDLTDVHKHPELKRKIYSSLAESDEGELAIPIPRQVAVKSTGHASGIEVVDRDCMSHL